MGKLNFAGHPTAEDTSSIPLFSPQIPFGNAENQQLFFLQGK